MRVRRPEVPLLGGAALVVATLTLVPAVYLLVRAFSRGGRPSLAAFADAYATADLGSMAASSIVYAVGATAIALVAGTALAFVLVRTDVPFRRVFFLLTIVPLLVPGVLYTIAWILLGAPRSGWINRALEPVFGPGTFDVFGMRGMVVVEGLHLAPLAFLLMAAAMRSVDPALEEAALVSGARWTTVVRRITVPLTRPALLASILILLVRCLESFEVPALLGIPDRVWVFSSRIWRALSSFPPRWSDAAALSVSLLVVTSIGVFAHARLTRRARSFQTLAARGFRPRPIALRRARPLVFAGVAAYVFVAVVLPLAVLVYASLVRFYTPPSLGDLPDFTIRNYTSSITDPANLAAFRHSLVLGAAAATVVAVLGALTAWIVQRSRLRGRWLLDDLAFLPLAMPGLVLGASLLFVYLRSPIPVYGTLWLLLIAYVTRYIPYGVRYAGTSMIQLRSELEEAAWTSGASWWQGFRRVVAPLILPGVAAGWLYVFALAIRELSTSILLYAPGTEVVSVRIWALYQSGQFPELAAVGVLLMVFVAALGAVSYRLVGRFGVAEA